MLSLRVENNNILKVGMIIHFWWEMVYRKRIIGLTILVLALAFGTVLAVNALGNNTTRISADGLNNDDSMNEIMDEMHQDYGEDHMNDDMVEQMSEHMSEEHEDLCEQQMSGISEENGEQSSSVSHPSMMGSMH